MKKKIHIENPRFAPRHFKNERRAFEIELFGFHKVEDVDVATIDKLKKKYGKTMFYLLKFYSVVLDDKYYKLSKLEKYNEIRRACEIFCLTKEDVQEMKFVKEEMNTLFGKRNWFFEQGKLPDIIIPKLKNS